MDEQSYTESKAPLIEASRRGLHIDGKFIVSWAELVRVHKLLQTMPPSAPLSRAQMEDIVAQEYDVIGPAKIPDSGEFQKHAATEAGNPPWSNTE